MTLTEASDLAAEALGGPVGEHAVRRGRLVAFFPEVETIDLGGIEVEFDRPGDGPALVNLDTREVEVLGSSVIDWPEWLADGEGEDVTIG